MPDCLRLCPDDPAGLFVLQLPLLLPVMMPTAAFLTLAAMLAAAFTTNGPPDAVQREEYAPNATFPACPVPSGLYGDVLDGNHSLPSPKSSIFDQLSSFEIYSVMFLLVSVSVPDCWLECEAECSASVCCTSDGKLHLG